MLPLVQAAEGRMLEALSFGKSGHDALLNVLDHSILATISVCRLACDVLAYIKSLSFKACQQTFQRISAHFQEAQKIP